MLKTEFFIEIKKLQDTYGDNSYPFHVREALFNEMEHIPYPKFKRVVQRVLANNPNAKYPPKVTEFEKVLAQIRESEWEVKKKEETTGNMSAEDITKGFQKITSDVFGEDKK